MKVWCSALALGLLLGAGSAAAEETPASAAQAKLRYEEGKAAYEDARFADAIRAFSEADVLAPRAALSFNIARAYERLGDRARALEHYRDYLRRAPDAENAATVRARIDTLEQAPDAAVPVAPAPAPALQPPPAPAPEADRPATFAPWSWIALGTGGALIVGAGIAEVARRDAEADARGAPTQLTYQADYQRMQTDQRVGRVLLGVGSALVVTGGVLLGIDLARSRRARTGFACLPGGCWGNIQGAF